MNTHTWVLPVAVWETTERSCFHATTGWGVSYSELMHMKPGEGVPDMLVHGYVSTDRVAMLLERPQTCELPDVIGRRPTAHDYAIVEVDNGVVWLLDLYDTQYSHDMMTATPGRRLEVRNVDAAIAAAAFGW